MSIEFDHAHETFIAARRWFRDRHGVYDTNVVRVPVTKPEVDPTQADSGQPESYPFNPSGQVVVDDECVHDSK